MNRDRALAFPGGTGPEGGGLAARFALAGLLDPALRMETDALICGDEDEARRAVTRLNGCAPRRRMQTARRLAAIALAAVASVLAVAAGGGADTGDAEEGPIRVIEAGYSIDYGRQVSLTLEVSSNAASISEIQAFFTPRGPGSIPVYSYLDFQAARTVRASFAIPTGGSHYYPPGTRFDVHYLVTDDDGNDLRTGDLSFDYLDPAFEWRHISRGGLSVVYHDRRASDVERMLNAAAERLPLMEETLGVRAAGVYRGVLVNTRREADIAFPFISEAARSPHAFAGFAFGRYGTFVLRSNDGASFVHELAHLLLSEAVSSPLARVPSWLNEGLSVYFETASGDASRSRLRRLARRGELPSLRSMNTIPGDLGRVSLHYAKSGSFVAYLIETFGPGRMSKMLASLEGGTPLEGAMQAVYGATIDQLDARFEAAFFGDPTPTPAPAIAPAEAPALAAPGETRGPVAATPAAVQSQTVPARSAADRGRNAPASPARAVRGLLLGGVFAGLALILAVSFLWRLYRRAGA